MSDTDMDGDVSVSKTAQAVSGAGVGTGAIGLAQLVGFHTNWGQVLIWAAPSIGFTSRWLLIVLNASINRMITKWKVRGSLKTLHKQLQNPHTSPEHKASIIKKIEEAERLIGRAELARIGDPTPTLPTQPAGPDSTFPHATIGDTLLGPFVADPPNGTAISGNDNRATSADDPDRPETRAPFN